MQAGSECSAGLGRWWALDPYRLTIMVLLNDPNILRDPLKIFRVSVIRKHGYLLAVQSQLIDFFFAENTFIEPDRGRISTKFCYQVLVPSCGENVENHERPNGMS